MNEVNGWRSAGRYSFTHDGERIHSAGHIAVVYHDENGLEVAFHQRSEKMRGGNKLGWPGGIADYYGETIYESVLRELKEECMSQTDNDGLNVENMYLIHAKKTYGKPLHFYGMFVIFVNDKRLITGPDKNSEWEVVENEELGMFKKNGYHSFFKFKINEETRRYSFENDKIDGLLWNISNMRKLVKALRFVKDEQNNDNQ